MITDTDALAALCDELAGHDIVCIDTEFMRERTFWPRLCLVQIAGADGKAAAVDPLADGLDLAPLLRLLDNENVTKVLHAGRQDIEIFVRLNGRVPGPVFDTQIAAMVCGFGEAASYATLVRRLAGASVDKASRFTDWSRRPLTKRQIRYALADVEHLPAIYHALTKRLAKTGRAEWVTEEMASLVDPANYDWSPERAWLRIKTRRTDPKFLAILQALAAVREQWAQERDIPRQRLARDDALIEIAAHEPADAAALTRTRSLSGGTANGPFGKALLAAVAAGLAVPESQRPPPPTAEAPRTGGPVVDLLKVLLKQRCQQHEVAQKLIASSDDLERLATGADDVPVLHGWRREVFGEDALALINGDLALAADHGAVETIRRVKH